MENPKGPAGAGEPAAATLDATGAGQEPAPEPAKKVASNGATLSAGLDGSPTAMEDTTPIIAQGLEVDPNIGATRFPFGAQLAYPDRGGIDPTQSTLAFWVRLDSAPETGFAGRVLAQLQAKNGNSLQINMGSRFIGLVLTNSTGEQTVSYTAMPWVPGVWHHIAMTWGENIMQLFVDGNLNDQESYAGTLELPPDALLYLGNQRADPTVTPPPGYPTVSLRAWNVFPTILEPEQIATLMVQTAPPT